MELDSKSDNAFKLGKFESDLIDLVRRRGNTNVQVQGLLSFHDKEVGADFFLGIHSLSISDWTQFVTFGGVRLLPSDSKDEAKRDALRLSEAMTHKLSMIDEPFGGSKMVVVAPASGKSELLLQRIGEYIHLINLVHPAFITAIDFGFEPEDAIKIREKTRFILGFDGPGSIGASGVPTAMGAFLGIPVLLEAGTGSPEIKGRRFAIQGLGSVGKKLAELILENGGNVIISDIDERKTIPFRGLGGVTVVEPSRILQMDADVICPCGPACVINPNTIPTLRTRMIAAVANCVLEDEVRDDRALRDHGILLAPDFVMNAGGVMQGIEEFRGKGLKDVIDKLPVIPKNVRAVFERANRDGVGTNKAARWIARERREEKHGFRRVMGSLE